MAAIISSHSPPRGRAGDSLTLGGSGFGASGNTVTVDGLAATVTAESATSVTVTVPGGITTDRFVQVVITHPTDGSQGSRYWWSKATPAEMQAWIMPLQQPGGFEDWGSASSQEHSEDIEAKDIEALYELLQYLPTDVLQTPGDMVGRNSNGLGQVAAGTAWTADTEGSVVMLDRYESGGASGINQRNLKSGVHTWGAQLSGSSATVMEGNSTSLGTTTNAAEQTTPNGGRLAILVVYVDAQGGTRELDRVRVMANSNATELYDSGTGLALAAQGYHVAQLTIPAGEIATTDRIAIELTADGGTSTIDCLAYLMVF